MAKVNCKRQTKHVYDRLCQRLNIRCVSEVKGLCHNASAYGVDANYFKNKNWEMFKYLKSREQFKNKRVKLYKGIVFIFSRTSDRCITAYPLPEELKKYEN